MHTVARGVCLGVSPGLGKRRRAGQSGLRPVARAYLHVLDTPDVGAYMHLDAGIEGGDVAVEKVVKLARCGVEAIIRVDKRNALHRGAVAPGLEQRPGIWPYVAGVLLGIPYREVAHAGAGVHLDEAVGYACIGGMQGVARLRVVPPALHRAVMVGRVLANAHLEHRAEHAAPVLFGVCPVAAQLNAGRQTEHILVAEALPGLVLSASHAHVLGAGLRAAELIVAVRHVHNAAAVTPSGVDGGLESLPVVKSRLGLRAEIGHHIV